MEVIQFYNLQEQELIQVNMAHFAILGPGNIVQQVLVVDNSIATTEQAGIDFLKKTFNDNHLPIIQTSYNTLGGIHINGGIPLRGNYAAIGYQYDQTNDVFYEIKPFDSWILNKTTWTWESPIKIPTDGNRYKWNESLVNWELVK